MSDTAFDTLGAARKLKAAGLEAKQAEAIVEVMDQSAAQFVTVKHFDAAIARLDARIDGLQIHIDAVRTELQASIDSVRTELQANIDTLRTEMQASIDTLRTEMQTSIDTLRAELQAGIGTTRAEGRADINTVRAEIARFTVIAVGVIIGANALMIGILSFFLRNGAVM